MPTYELFSPIVAAIVALSVNAAILFSRVGKKVHDIPNERSLHTVPTPRIGGIGLMAGALSGWVLMFASLAWWLVLPLGVLFAISLLDDIYNLPVRNRLLAQLGAAALLVAGSGLLVQQGAYVAVLVLLGTVWMTNLYNFMDGSDGLAGGMALFGFAFYGFAALFAHDEMFAMLNFSVSAAALSFLYFNFPPARIFMGDAGSIPLGFLAGGLGLWGWQLRHWPAWFPLLVFSPFIVDATLTLIKRALRGVKITEAHREHYYQRAIQLGWGHRNVALAEYVLMFAVGACGLWGLKQNMAIQLLLLLFWLAMFLGLMAWVDKSWGRFMESKTK